MAIDERYRVVIRDLVGAGVLTGEQGSEVESALDAVPDAPRVEIAATGSETAAGGSAGSETAAGGPAGSATVAPAAKAGWVAEVAGYLGGGLMLCGLVLVFGASWSSLSRGSRIGVIALAFALLVGAAVVIAGGRLRALGASAPSAQRRVVGTLFGIAVAPVTPLIGLSVEGSHHQWSIGTVVATAVAAAGLWLVPNLFGVLVLAVISFIAPIVVVADVTDEGSRGWAGVAVLVCAVAWAVAALSGWIRPRHLGLGVAAVFGLIGAQMLYGFTDWPAYTVTAAGALACLGLYRVASEPVLVVAAVLGVTIAVPEAVSDWTDGGLGAAYIVLVGGAVLVAGSVVALRLRRTREVG